MMRFCNCAVSVHQLFINYSSTIHQLFINYSLTIHQHIHQLHFSEPGAHTGMKTMEIFNILCLEEAAFSDMIILLHTFVREN